jgi:BolA family transcriptional regulator, general stress-responsive regulator
MLNAKEIEERLNHLNPSYITISDDSHKHAEHIENPTGGLTHATITLVSEKFEGLTSVARHKLIYSSLKDALAAGSLHALCLKTFTAEEWDKKS